MVIDIIVGVIACLIVTTLLTYFIISGVKKKSCNCEAAKKYRKSLKKAKKEIINKKEKH